MQASRLVVLDFDESGRPVPVDLDHFRDETAGFTTPPDGMPSKWRDQWQVIRKRALAQGEAPEVAWYQACAAVVDLQANWRDKVRKRFFRA